MRKIVSIIILLFVVTISLLAQQTHVIEMPFDGTLVKREITFPVSCGEGSQIGIPMEFQYNKSNQTFSMTFKSTYAGKDKFLYLFVKPANKNNVSMKDIKKKYPNVWFSKEIKKDSKKRFGRKSVKPYGNNIPLKDTTQFFELSQDFTKILSQDKFEGTLYAYIAITNQNTFNRKRNRQIRFLAEVPFKIYPVKPCENKQVIAKIEEFKKINTFLSDSIKRVNEETVTLQSLSCESFKKQSLQAKKTKSEGDYSYSDCKDCNECGSFITEKNKLYNSTIRDYNSAVNEYNQLLQTLQGKYKGPCPAPCHCDCNALKNNVETKLGPLFVQLSQNIKNKTEARNELNAIKKSIKCYGAGCKSKDCNSICNYECKVEYRAFLEYCTKIEELLKSR